MNDERLSEVKVARCMKCKKQVEIVNRVGKVTKNKMLMVQGECAECGTKVCRMVGKAKEEDMIDSEGEIEVNASNQCSY